MEDGTSSEGSHSYASDAPCWDFGDDANTNKSDVPQDQGQVGDGSFVTLLFEASQEDPRVGDVQVPAAIDWEGAGGPERGLLRQQSQTGLRNGDGPQEVIDLDEGQDGVAAQAVRSGDNQDVDEDDDGRHGGENQHVDGAGDIESTGVIDRVDNGESSHSTVINLNGFPYTRSRQSARSISYRCSVYRRTGCKGKVQFDRVLSTYVNFVAHSCSVRIGAPATVVDVVGRMQGETDRLATTNQTLTANQIWDQVRLMFFNRGDGVVVRGLTRMQVMSRVHRTRRTHFGGDVHGVIEVPPLSLAAGVDLQFFQFHHAYYDDGTLQRIIGWAHPRLLELLRYPGPQLFVDGTFRSVPRSFHQCGVDGQRRCKQSVCSGGLHADNQPDNFNLQQNVSVY